MSPISSHKLKTENEFKMQFSTKVKISKSKSSIDYQSKIFSIGSCFAVNMASKMDYFKLQNCSNPFGILFHPLAIEKFLKNALEGKIYSAEDVFFANERYHCYDAHSDLSNRNLESIVSDLNTKSQKAAEDLKTATHIIITLGTAWIYRNVESNEIVANCHKVPQKNFSKELLSVDEISRSLQSVISLLESSNPQVKIIFTISPVRHIKDGIVENQRSKSHLFAALHEVLDKNLAIVEYFPSYEIMMHELRDYRFYADDMLHPSNIAIEYIWEAFRDAYCSEEVIAIMKEIGQIQQGLLHRSFSPDSEAHQRFLDGLRKRIEVLEGKWSGMRF